MWLEAGAPESGIVGGRLGIGNSGGMREHLAG